MQKNKDRKDMTSENRSHDVSLNDGLDTSKAIRLLQQKQQLQKSSENKKKED